MGLTGLAVRYRPRGRAGAGVYRTRFLHRIDDGGGPQAAAEGWEELRVQPAASGSASWQPATQTLVGGRLDHRSLRVNHRQRRQLRGLSDLLK